jgi:N-methylhydantoinase A
LNEESIRAAARFFRKHRVRAAAVCLVHSYANAAHERRVGELLREEYPELVVSLSCDVLPEYREYERAVTTLVDAFVKPHMAVYLRRIRAELGEALGAKPFLVMQSSGGVVSAERCAAHPISTVLSGPAAGTLGASMIARLAGFPDAVTLDAGGTSTDICLIEGGAAHITNSSTIGSFPVRVPMIDIHTIGTGGGSIAWISREGHLKVGPKSAGAVPGPMCYPEGGEEPTITDANLALGRLPPALIGGGIALSVERARAGLAALAARLGGKLSVEALGEGILEIANWNQANAIRQMTIQKGIDPRRFALLSFGGSGPAQSPAVARLLGMKCCLVPPHPGNVSAFGLLAVDWRTDHVATRVTHEDAVDLVLLSRIYSRLEDEALETLERDGIERSRVRLVREADLRYVGQSMEVRVSAPSGFVDPKFLNELTANFHSAHRRAFGYDYAGKQKVELVNFRVCGFGLIEHANLPKLRPLPNVIPAKKAARRVYFDGAWTEAAIYERAALPPGCRIEGPAVIEEFGSTTVVFPGQFLEVDPYGILVLREKITALEERR